MKASKISELYDRIAQCGIKAGDTVQVGAAEVGYVRFKVVSVKTLGENIMIDSGPYGEFNISVVEKVPDDDEAK